MRIRPFSDPVRVLSVGRNPIQVLLIRSDLVQVLSIRSDPTGPGFVNILYFILKPLERYR